MHYVKKCKWSNLNYHATVWKNAKFTLTEKIFRQINPFLFVSVFSSKSKIIFSNLCAQSLCVTTKINRNPPADCVEFRSVYLKKLPSTWYSLIWLAWGSKLDFSWNETIFYLSYTRVRIKGDVLSSSRGGYPPPLKD